MDAGRQRSERGVALGLLGFVFRHFLWFYVALLAVVAAVASRTSVLLAVVSVVASVVVIEAVMHNWNPLTRRLRERDDEVFFHGCRDGVMSGPRRLYRWLPSDPRCRLCLVPFGGVGKLLLIRPSRKNPNFCTDCFESTPVKAYEREVGILFADIRGFTAWSEQRPPAEVEAMLTRFYDVASRVLTRDDALVEFIGDQVMALYLPEFPSLGPRTSDVMMAAAERLLGEISRRGADMLPVGVGMHIGVASVGNVGQGTQNFTAVGDVVNTAARLQSAALGGQIVVSQEIRSRAMGPCQNAEPVSLSLKGKSEPVHAYVMRAG